MKVKQMQQTCQQSIQHFLSGEEGGICKSAHERRVKQTALSAQAGDKRTAAAICFIISNAEMKRTVWGKAVESEQRHPTSPPVAFFKLLDDN